MTGSVIDRSYNAIDFIVVHISETTYVVSVVVAMFFWCLYSSF
jgi:hypothetical protein